MCSVQHHVYTRLAAQSLQLKLKTGSEELPGGQLVKNPPASAGDTALIPGPGRFHMAQAN